MQAIETYQSFHDWYLVGVEVDEVTKTVVLNLLFDNRKDRVRLVFSGATLLDKRIPDSEHHPDHEDTDGLRFHRIRRRVGSARQILSLGTKPASQADRGNRGNTWAELLIECEAVEAQSLDPRAE